MSAFVKSHWKVLVVIGALCLLFVSGLYLWRAYGASVWVVALGAVAAVLLLGLFILITRLREKLSIEKIFLLVLLVLGMSYAAVFTPGSAPDEPLHFQTSYQYSNLILGKGIDDTSMVMRQDDAVFMLEKDVLVTGESYSRTAKSLSLFSHDSSEVTVATSSAFSAADAPPQLKLASALGISLARILDLGGYLTYYIGRLFNFLLFAILAYFAVKITPVGKPAFMAISLLPMTLHVVSSYSYDAGIIGLSLLLASLFFRAIYTKEKVRPKLIAGILLTAVLLAPCKLVYALLVFLGLLIPSQRFSSKLREVVTKASFFVLPFLTIILFKLQSVMQLAGISQGAGAATELVRENGTGTLLSLSDFLADPIQTIYFFVKTLDFQGDFFLNTLLGGSLGWFQTEIESPLYLVVIFGILLALSFLKNPSDELTATLTQKVVYSAIIAAGVLLIMLSMYFAHTLTTDLVIHGVQGRYFIPFLPLLALVVKNKTLILTKNPETYILFGFCYFNFVYLMRIFAIASTLPA